jgi:hypothetical protein
MAPISKNPTPRARRRARKASLLTIAETFETSTPPHHNLQIRYLVACFGLTVAVAKVVAELAFPTGRAA